MTTRSRTYLIAILPAIVLALAIVAFQFQTDIRLARDRVSTGSQVVRTACGPIEYAIAGSGPPVLMVHGAGGGFDQGLEFAAPLANAGFTIIAPSRFGYLRTPLPADASPEAQAEAHACLLDALGIGAVIAIGGSAGAPSVTQLCLRHPERCSKMVLMVPATSIEEPGGGRILPSRLAQSVIRTALKSDFVFWTGSTIARDTLIESILATPMRDVDNAPPDEQQRVLSILKHIQPVSLRAQGLWTDSTVTTAPAQIDFERIVTPTLIISTENDGYGTIVGSRIAARRIPNAQLITYPDGGHLWVGHQAEVWAAVMTFLGSATTGATRSQ